MSHHSEIVAAEAATPSSATRHDGWTPERRTRFLDHLAANGDVRAASACAGMSREAAYRLRRRDALFGRAWAAALVLAREATGEVLGNRAIDGVEEEIWFRGELVGSRRKYDSRLLLAHMARLDRLAEDGDAADDAARFDELLAANAGITPPADLDDGDGWAVEREDYAERCAQDAENDEMAKPTENADCATGSAPDLEAREQRCLAAAREARSAALDRWDAWFARAVGTLDAMAVGSSGPVRDVYPCTVSTVSTSPAVDPASSLRGEGPSARIIC